MTYDAATPIDVLLHAYDHHATLEQFEAARAELTRRSELAAKYERLTRALHGVAYSESGIIWGEGRVRELIAISVPELGGDWEDESGEGIAAAIIAADDAEQAKRNEH
jgi:hypothetical protein